MRATVRVLGPALAAAALAAPAAAQQMTLQRYGKPDGLANPNVLCLLQDGRRFLWACTENGLYRYDGHRFRRYGEADGLDNTLVYAAGQDAQGRLWLRTSSDLYVGEHGRFAPVRPEGRALPSAADGGVAVLPDGQIAVVVQHRLLRVRAGGGDGAGDDGGRWQALPAFSEAEIAAQPALGEIASADATADGRLWLGCGRTVCELGPDGVHVWTPAEGVPDDRWMRFLADRSGRLWLRGENTLLMRPAGARTFENVPLPGLKLSSQLNAALLAEGPDGSILVRTTAGLARWSRGRWIERTTANGLWAPSVTALAYDHEGSLWIGIGGHGLGRWLGQGRVESWTEAQGLDAGGVWGLLRPDPETLLAGTEGGCAELAEGAARVRRCNFDGLPPGGVQALAQAADGTLWIAAPGYVLMKVEPGSRVARRVAQLPRFTSMLVDSRQRLWVPTRRGVYVLEPGDTAPRQISEDAEFLDAAQADDGAVWVAGGNGLRRYADGTWHHMTLDDPRAQPGFASIAIGRDGTLWAASRSRGLLRASLHGTAFENPRWIDDPMVADAAPMFVRVDARQRVWFGSDFGVAAFDGRQWRRLTETDGLIWNDVDYQSFAADPDGSVWIGTSRGLSHVVDPGGALAPPPLGLDILAARYADRAVPLAAGSRWPWARVGAFDIDLASFSFSRSADAVFRWRIAGVDAGWFESPSPRVHYPALEPGRYRFEAMVVDPDRGQQSPVVAFDFEVTPPWWGTLAFRGAVAVLLFAALAFGWRWQVARLTARHARAQREAQERHQLIERASRDALTGLWNRATIMDLLAQAIERRASGEPLALAVLDVDHFKRVNDRYGHATGDELLRELCRRLGAKLRQHELLGRYGGEELLLILHGLAAEVPAGVVERLRARVADEPFTLGEHRVPVTVSIGIAWFGQSSAVTTGDSVEQLFERADQALYRAKQGGRNRVEYALPQA